jgi:N-acetylmuramoyl-L-alanine amidase
MEGEYMGAQTLFIAAGHGGQDKGNTSAGIIERDELIQIVGGMRKWFADLSVPNGLGGVVFLDDALDLAGEISTLQRWRPTAADSDMAVNVHLDFKPTKADGGALVLYDETPYARAFSEYFLIRWCKATGIANNGVFRSSDVARSWRGWDDFGFCRPGWPGVIVELGCLSHVRDMQIVRNQYYRLLAGQLIYNAWQAVT